MPRQRVIIVADDLAGATDCGAAFAARGLVTRAALHHDVPPGAPVPGTGDAGFDAAGPLGSGCARGWSVLALDTDTRDAPEPVAERRAARAAAVARPGDLLFDKLDSTLRGHPAAELRGLVAGRRAERVLAAPAFPATGRTTRDGRQLLDGRPLQDTEFGPHAGGSHVGTLLAGAGLPITSAPLSQVRGAGLGALMRDSNGVLVFDAETDDDLDRVAEAGLAHAMEAVWVGSAGLARALARALAPEAAPPRSHPAWGPVLLVVGSPARASRAQLRRLCRESEVEPVDAGRAEPGDLRRALEGGRDCVVCFRDAGPDRDGGGASRRLAELVAGAQDACGALVLTGGQTARTVLSALSVGALELVDELAPGVALCLTGGGRRLPVAIKAGGFGDEEVLVRCRAALRGGALAGTAGA